MNTAMLQSRHLVACRRGLWLPLAACLLLAQMLWMTHQIQHQLHHDRTVCTTCLGLAGANTPVASPPLTAIEPPADTFAYRPCDLGTGRSRNFCYQSRAPPQTPS